MDNSQSIVCRCVMVPCPQSAWCPHALAV